jgi:hypothetical protein
MQWVAYVKGCFQLLFLEDTTIRNALASLNFLIVYTGWLETANHYELWNLPVVGIACAKNIKKTRKFQFSILR